MNDTPIFQSKPPIAFYVGIAISLIVFTNCIFRISFPDSLIYPSIVFGFWFLTVSRYSGQLIVFTDKVLIKYMGFWHADKEIAFADKERISVKLNYWNFSDRFERTWYKGHVFFDTINFIGKENRVDSIRVNIRIGQLFKAIELIDNQIKNKR